MENQFSLKGKVCVITGAGKGIGKEVSHLFNKCGARLSLITRDMQDFNDLDNTFDLEKDNALLYEGDVSCEDTVSKFVEETINKFKKIDVLINNAGIRFRKKFIDITLADWNSVINTNLGSVYLMCRETGRHMIHQRKGKIINMASIVGTLGLPELAAYGASKGAMITATKAMAIELASFKIRVNAINPVAGETGMLHLFMGEDTPEKRAQFVSSIPWGRLSQPQDMANAALFLCSDEADMVTGTCMEVDGGRCI